jgi:hypothetical protein
MTANQTVAAVVELERRRRGLTRLQLAELLGKDSGWVSKKVAALPGAQGQGVRPGLHLVK